MNEELISVIVPVYNAENFLTSCVDSVTAQTYKNIEIIFVDDGSTDSSPKLCDELAQKDKRIKVIHQRNGGISAARNTGIANATGKYVCFIDNDDHYATNYVELLYSAIKKENADVAMGNHLLVDDEYNPIDSLNKKKYEVKNGVYSGKELLYSSEEVYIVCWTKMYKKELIKDVLFPVGRLAEDNTFMHRSLSKATKVVCIKDYIYFWRQRSTSVSHSIDFAHTLDHFCDFEDKISCYQENGWSDLVAHTQKQLVNEAIKRLLRLDELNLPKQKKNQLKQDLLRYTEKYCPIIIKSKYIKPYKRFKIAIFFFFPALYKICFLIDKARHDLKYKIITPNTHC